MKSDELEARECIRDTLARYNHAGDRGRLSELAACFAPDGVLELSSEDLSTGPAEIEARLSRVVSSSKARATRPLVRHHVSSIEISMEGPDEAQARCYFLVFTEVGLDHWGRYADRFECRDGVWCLAHRRVRVSGATANSRMASEYAVEA